MQALDFYWLRQPLLSIERLLDALADDSISSLLADENVLEAIRIASPSVANELAKGSPLSSKIEETLFKYIVRMSTRCTPFGLFAGGTVGYVAEKTQLNFRYRTLVPQHRLDMQVLVNLAHKLAMSPSIRCQLRFVTNGSTHRIGNRIRYIESHWSGDRWHYFTSEVPADPHIITVLELARSGALLSDLVKAVADEATQAEATQFVDRLVEDGLLCSELLPTPTGADPLTCLIEKIGKWSVPTSAFDRLVAIQQALSEANAGQQPSQEIKTILEKQLGVSVGDSPYLQTDTRFDQATNHISRHVIKVLQTRLAPLHVLSQFNTVSDDLTDFKQRFYARYEEEEVPLLLALDEDIGVGYGNSIRELASSQDLISELLSSDSIKPVSTFRGDALHELRSKLYSSWSLQADQPVIITDQDLARLSPKTTTLPDSCYAFGYFLSSSSTDLDLGQYRFYLKAISGPSAFTLMGRFCASDDELHKLVSVQLRRQQEKQPNRILAEVVHLSQPRSGNVVQRPHLRPYEIPLLVTSSLPIEQQISLDDLFITVPGGNQVVLRSKRLAKEVVPQLTTAHNYQHGLPIYRFLSDLQHQPISFSVQWTWGALAHCRRLPRVQYKDIILQEATWVFTSADLMSEASDEDNVFRLRQQNQLPRLIALQQGDQELFLDLDSSVCRQLFVSTLRRLERLQVIEWLRTPSNCPVAGTDGKLTHEIVVPFVKQATLFDHQPLVLASKSVISPSRRRSFPPGSEWLYLKVYCGTTTATLVIEQVASLAKHLLDQGQVNHWFFIRYNDPDPHLRFRFKLTEVEQYEPVLIKCQEALTAYITSGEIHRLLTDTYRRELERYGDLNIEPTERIFWRDSELVSDLFKLNLTESWLVRAALRGIDAYQSSFGLTHQEKQLCCQQMYNALFAKQGSSKSLQQALARQYRATQSSVRQLIESDTRDEEGTLFEFISRFHKSIKDEVTSVTRNLSRHEYPTKASYIDSLGHMFINRLFSVNQPFYELLVYHQLYRAHQSINKQLMSVK